MMNSLIYKLNFEKLLRKIFTVNFYEMIFIQRLFSLRQKCRSFQLYSIWYTMVYVLYRYCIQYSELYHFYSEFGSSSLILESSKILLLNEDDSRT